MTDRLSHTVHLSIDQMEFLAAKLVGDPFSRDILLSLQEAIRYAKAKEQNFQNQIEAGI